MDEKTLTYKINNKNIKKKILKKMTLIYNALDNGWSVRKKNNDVYIFNKPHGNKKEIIIDEYLDTFMKENFDFNKILNSNEK